MSWEFFTVILSRKGFLFSRGWSSRDVVSCFRQTRNPGNNKIRNASLTELFSIPVMTEHFPVLMCDSFSVSGSAGVQAQTAADGRDDQVRAGGLHAVWCRHRHGTRGEPQGRRRRQGEYNHNTTFKLAVQLSFTGQHFKAKSREESLCAKKEQPTSCLFVIGEKVKGSACLKVGGWRLEEWCGQWVDTPQ